MRPLPRHNASGSWRYRFCPRLTETSSVATVSYVATRNAGSRLRRFREQRGISLREGARQLHVAHPALHAWEEEEQVPAPAYRDAIEVWTSGAVRANDWPLTEREQEIVENAARVRPATTPKPAA